MKPYVLFGAGANAANAVRIIGKDKVAFIVDNDKSKMGTDISEIPVYYFPEKEKDCASYQIVITTSEKFYYEISMQLEDCGIHSYISLNYIQMQKTKEKIQNRFNCIEVYEHAIEWIKNHSIDGHAIMCTSERRKEYPEVTGYYIPTLLRWGYRVLALNYAEWLLQVQKKDGSWYDTDDRAPYIFDTAQILKGLIAARELYKNTDVIDRAIQRGTDWILSCMTAEGQLVTPDKECWGNDESMCSELIHLYCLSPLIEAGKLYHKEEYSEKAQLILNYYKENYLDKILNFSLLSHFYSYVIEALVDLGEEDLARSAMKQMETYQKKSGAISAYYNVDWTCSTGMFQMAVIWYKLGDFEHGEKTFQYACRLQNETGGWYGSYLSEDNEKEMNNYFPLEEISWANKYFLDALYYRNCLSFQLEADCFIEIIAKEDERYCIIRERVSKAGSSAKILDVGCGKGRYIKNLLEEVPDCTYFGVDISTRVMDALKGYPVECREGTLTHIPYEDKTFAVTYTCEALEHAVDFESAIREMVRVTQSGGYIIVIDKNDENYGMLEIGEWEHWPNENRLKELMEQYCRTVEVRHGLQYDEVKESDLFTAWIGKVK